MIYLFILWYLSGITGGSLYLLYIDKQDILIEDIPFILTVFGIGGVIVMAVFIVFIIFEIINSNNFWKECKSKTIIKVRMK